MHIGDNEARPGFLILEEADDRNVVLCQNAVKHMICLLEIRTLHCKGVELDKVLLDQSVPVGNDQHTCLRVMSRKDLL
jgi:hypothetical protein